MPITIEPYQVWHAPQAANIHAQGQEDTFLTSLGPEFLLALYKAMALSPECVGYVALADSPSDQAPGSQSVDREVVGVVMGTPYPDTFLSRVLRRGWRALVPSVMGAILRRPGLVGRILETLFYPGQERAQPGEAELLFIGVLEEWHRQGIGLALFHALLEDLDQRGAVAMGLTVDDANKGAQAFYRARGMRPRHQFSLYGRSMHWYAMPIRFPEAAPQVHEARAS